MQTTRSRLRELTTEECMRLLRGVIVRVARVAYVDGGRPVILPVNFLVDRDEIVFRTEPDSSLAKAADGREVAFEVDKVEPAWEDGWSVVVRGPATRITDPELLERARRLPLRPWAGGDRPVYIRLEPVEVSGRRIV